MQRFLVYLRPGQIDILNDSINDAVKQAADFGYLLDNKPNEKSYDIVIASAHDENTWLQKSKGKLIVVLSYVPAMTSKEWPSFYVNMCMADAIACDSWVRNRLKDISYPEKRMINLDGCTPVKLKTVLEIDTVPDKIPLYNLDVGQPDIWERFNGHVTLHNKKEFTIAQNPSKHAVGISFNGVGNCVAVCMAHKLRHVSVRQDEFTSSYLDTRCNNTIKNQIGNLIGVQGGGSMQRIKEAFDTYIDELIILLNHSKTNPLWKFTSNSNIYDRIYHELNRTQTG